MTVERNLIMSAAGSANSISSGNVLALANTGGQIYKINATSGTSVLWVTASGGSDATTDFAIDSNSNVYVANYTAGKIAKITKTGSVDQSWATLPAGSSPRYLAIDPSNNLYVYLDNNTTLSKITSGGTITNSWASLSNSVAGMITDSSGNVYVGYTVSGGYGLKKVSTSASITNPWATYGSTFNNVKLILDSSNNLYDSNLALRTVYKITSAASVSTVYTFPVGQSPQALAINSSNGTYYVGMNQATVAKITSGGTVTENWASSYAGISSMSVNSTSGDLFTLSANRVNKISSSGSVSGFPWPINIGVSTVKILVVP